MHKSNTTNEIDLIFLLILLDGIGFLLQDRNIYSISRFSSKADALPIDCNFDKTGGRRHPYDTDSHTGE